MYLSSPGSPNPPPSVRSVRASGTRDGIRAQVNERRDLIACRLPGRVHRKQLPVLPRERAAQQLRRRARDATLEQRALRPRIDNGGAELPQHADGALDEVDAFLVGLGQQRAIEVFAHDADAQARERPRGGRRQIGRARRPADAERRELVLRVVAGDHVEDPRRVLPPFGTSARHAC